MKAILSTLCFFLINTAFATDYYFSSISGNDSRTNVEAQDPNTPWKTLDKLNSFSGSLKPGDGVYLKRDEIFYGSIVLKSSGTTSLPIRIGAYGSGNRPVITSLITLDNWISTGNGVWESATQLDSSLNMVLLNGIEQEMGRYPNSNAVNSGYLNFEAHFEKTSITDNQLNTSINWVGAELVTRPRHWILNRSLITGQSDHTISYTTNSPYEPFEKYGYFIQNSLKTLDRIGEWYFNPSTRKLSVYFGSDGPSPYIIEATTMGNLISCTSKSNIVFDNLTVKGANGSGFLISNGSNIFIQNCDILFSGVTGALVNGHNNCHIENCTISNSNNCGIDMEYNVKNAVIKNNKILNSALIAGLIKNGEGTGLGIYSNGEGADIESNEILNTGFIGITFYGSNVIIKNNVIDRFCFVKDDGGGIYSHGGSDLPTNRKISGNVITNGIGAGPGTDNANKRSVSGIYMDANLWNIDITGNTVTSCFQGIFLQSSNGITVTNNTVFNNDRQLIIIQREANNLVRNINVSQNNLFSLDPDQWVLYIMSNANDIDSFGTFDYNYYARPVDDGLTISNTRIADGKTVNEIMDLAGWQNRYGEDEHTKKSTVTIPATQEAITGLIRFEYNATSEDKAVTLNGKYTDVTGKRYSNTITLQPYTSLVLIKTGEAGQRIPPTVNITSPANNANLTALAPLKITTNADDVDGFVTRVDFYNGNILIGSTTTSPYSFTWNSVPAGNYTLTAKAVDDDDLQTTSAEVSIAVAGIKLSPVVSITEPEVNSTYTSRATIVISAVASDSDGTIRKVEFFNGTTLLNTVSASPYTFTWQNVPAGDYSLTAKATDDDGLTTLSAVVIVSVTGAITFPVVHMTAPAVNATYDAPATIVMSAVASDADGSVSKVEFYNGDNLLNSQQSPPYDFTWQNVPPGDYLLTAKATDDDGLTTTSDVITVSVTAVQSPPVISITAPAVNSTYNAPATITMSADATDADGSVSKVEFFNGNTLLNSQQTPPYTFIWQDVAAGNYSLTAKATDNDGLTTTSGAVAVSVNAAKTQPVVTITAPVVNSTYTAPATIEISAVATDNDGSISKVEFFSGTTLLNTQQSAPYNFTWLNAPAGNYSLTVKATDNDGLTTISDAVAVSVTSAKTPPLVNITGPVVNAVYTEPAAITISATATDNDGSIGKVEFFSGTTLLNTQQSSPYSFTWQNVPAGSYSFTVKATDNDGLTTTSNAVSVLVRKGLVAPVVNLTAPVTSTYTAPATIVMSATATDADGTIGKVEFFNGTTLLNTSSSSPYTFTWQNVPAGNYSLTAKATDNDGVTSTSATKAVTVTAVVVVPGAPVVSLTSPANNSTYKKGATITITATARDADGSISKVEFFNGTILLSTQRSSPYSFAWKNVAAGNYSITARATDNKGLATTSAAALISVVSGTPPVVNMTSPLNNATYNAPASISMSATASDADGSISKVEFFNGTTLLKSLPPSSSYTYTWTNVAAGNYTLTAKATDNTGNTTISAARTVVIKAVVTNKPPTISITKPLANASFTAPANIQLAATASDADGSVSKVEFFKGTTLLKTESTAPYTYAWNAVPAGSYTITARATDNKGAVTTSAPVIVTVKPTSAARNSVSEDLQQSSKMVPAGNNSGKTLSPTPGFRLLPNPAINKIQIYFDERQTAQYKADLSILNAVGALVKKYPITLAGRKIEIDIASLPAGIYTIVLSNDKVIVNKKFVKVN